MFQANPGKVFSLGQTLLFLSIYRELVSRQKSIGSLVLLTVLLVSSVQLCGAAVTAEANRQAEISFESTKSYADPFSQVTLDAVFTAPGGQVLRVPAFWAGGNIWRVRYASPQTGTHLFLTECSDVTNSVLHKVGGEVVVTPYTGSNTLFSHGPVRVAEDGRHFAYADGTPFFWLGDTWWMGLVKRLQWPGDFQKLAADRKEKGFTVVQIVAGLYPDMPAFDERGLGDEGFPWERSYTRIRPEYFDAADRRIQYLVEQGLMPCILGCWGYHLPWLGQEKMKQHWRYLIARWGALPVVWCVSGEQAMPWYNSRNREIETQQLRREWTEVIRSIRAIDPFKRLITTHPRINARDEVLDPALLDFEMQQSGHRSPTEQHAHKALQAWNRSPFVPVISGESRYEALEIKPTLGAREARQAFWAHLLNSGCAGHTYGANGIWQVNLPGQRFGKSPGGNDWGGTSWRDAMNLPGSMQLSRAKKFLLTLPWYQLVPATNVFSGATSAAVTADGRCALAFSAGGQVVSLDPARLNGSARAQWFDPACGELKAAKAEPVRKEASVEFVPPGKNASGDSDWILLLTVRRTSP